MTRAEIEMALTEQLRRPGATVTLTTRRTPRTFGATCPECGVGFTVDTCPYWHWSKSKRLHERGTGHRVYYMNVQEQEAVA